MANDKQKFKAFREELSRQGLTVRQVALKADIIPSHLYACLNGSSKFWGGWQDRIAAVLGKSADELFGEKEGDEK